LRGGWDYLLLSITKQREVRVRVQRVVMPDTEFESWTVLGDDHLPVEPVERFLAYLASIEKSPNTITQHGNRCAERQLALASLGPAIRA
jgi:hypothetical protein